MEHASLEGSVKILILVGAVDDDSKGKYILTSIKAGLEKWARKMNIVPAMDECLALFSKECKIFGHSDALAPHSKLAYTKNNISVLVLFSPTCVMVNNGIAELILSPCSGRLVVYGGHFVDSQPNWFFQDGIFAVEDLEYVLNDKEITDTLLRTNIQSKITVSCCEASQWELSKKYPQVEMEFVDPFSPAGELTDGAVMDGLKKFVEDLEETLKEQVGGIFFQLSPPKHKSFLRVQKPCIYIFPAGNGDSAFFKVDGFNVLVNGGALTRPWFWHLIRHEYRVDCVIATHLGNDSLSGLNSFLLRKVHEQKLKFPKDQECEEFKYLSKFMLSPDLGGVFINAPSKFVEGLRKRSETTDDSSGDSAVGQQLNIKTSDTVRDTFRLLKALQVQAQPLTRKAEVEPITLFDKWNVGKLKLFVMNPDEESRELDFIRQKWGSTDKSIRQMTKSGVKMASGEEGQSLVSDLASICCLLVWFPSSPKERIIRVLFPGNTSEAKIFEGLEKMKHLDFLTTPIPVAESLEKNKGIPKTTKSTTSLKTRTIATSKPSAASRPSGHLLKPTSPASAKVPSTAGSKANETKRVVKTTSTSVKTSQQATKSSSAQVKATTAVNKPSKVSTAPKKPIGVSKSAMGKEENAATRTKRGGLSLASPADKRPKPEKLQTSQALPAKTRKGPVHAKAEARVKTKRATEKVAPKTAPSSKPITSKQTKSFEFRKAIDAKPKKKAVTSSTTKKAKESSSPIAVKNTEPVPPTSKSSQEVSSSLPETLIQSLETLRQEISENKESMMKRPTPEGQDRAEQEEFLEVHSDIEILKPQNDVDIEKEKKTDASKDEVSYLSVSPNVKEQEDITPGKGDALDVEILKSVDEKEASGISMPDTKASLSEDDFKEPNPLLDVSDKPSEEPTSAMEKEEDFLSYRDASTKEDFPIESSLHQTEKEDLTISFNIGPDATLEPLKTEFAQLRMEDEEMTRVSKDEALKPGEIAPENQHQEPETDPEADEGLCEDLDRNDGFYVETYEQDEAFDGPLATAVDVNDKIADTTPKSKQEISDLTKQQEIEDIMELPISEPHSISPESTSTDLTQSCDSETISEPEQKYLEIQDSAPAREIELMSSTPLSSGPSLSTENFQELPTPQDVASLSSGIVEFNNIENEKNSALELLPRPQVDDNVSSPSPDVATSPEPDNEIRTESIYDPYPTVVGAETDDVDIIQSESSCYDDNGNRTEINYKVDVEETESRTDSILNWNADTGVVCTNVRCDDDVIASDDVDGDDVIVSNHVVTKPDGPVLDRGIVSFRDSEDNLAGEDECESPGGIMEQYGDEDEPISHYKKELGHPVELEEPLGREELAIDVETSEDQGLEEDLPAEKNLTPNSNFPEVNQLSDDANPDNILIQPLQTSSQGFEDKDVLQTSSQCFEDKDVLQTSSQCFEDKDVLQTSSQGFEDKDVLQTSSRGFEDKDVLQTSSQCFEDKDVLQTSSQCFEDKDVLQTSSQCFEDKDVLQTSSQGFEDKDVLQTSSQGFENKDVLQTSSQCFEDKDVLQTSSQCFEDRDVLQTSSQCFEDKAVLQTSSQCFEDKDVLQTSSQGFEDKDVLQTSSQGFEDKDVLHTSSQCFEDRDVLHTSSQGFEDKDVLHTSSQGFEDKDVLHTSSQGFEDRDVLHTSSQGFEDEDVLHTSSQGFEDEDVLHTSSQGFEDKDVLPEQDLLALDGKDKTSKVLHLMNQDVLVQVENLPTGGPLPIIEPDQDLNQSHAEQKSNQDVKPLDHVLRVAISESQNITSDSVLTENDTSAADIEKVHEERRDLEDFHKDDVPVVDNLLMGNNAHKGDASLDSNPTLCQQVEEPQLQEPRSNVVQDVECNLSVLQDGGDIVPDQSAKAEAPHVFAANNPFMADIAAQDSPIDAPLSHPIKEEDPKMAPPDRASSAKPRKPAATKKTDHSAFYFDLTYIPHHANKNNCGVEFFKRIRSKYYVLSGFDAKKQEPSPETLEALLEGKRTWSKESDSEDTNVSVVPTHNSNALFNWYEKNHQELNAENIHLVAIGSRVKMHDENIEACKIEL